jgi:hypothetical protein
MGTGHSIRDQIMRALLEHGDRGAAAYMEARMLAARLGSSVAEVESWPRICRSRGWVRLLPTPEGNHIAVEMLTPAGRQHAKDLASPPPRGGQRDGRRRVRRPLHGEGASQGGGHLP